ncbi:MAG: hypothetical protein ACLFSC_08915 [Wenzhouxiangella sp.]
MAGFAASFGLRHIKILKLGKVLPINQFAQNNPPREMALKSVSQIQTKRIVNLRIERIGSSIGRLDHSELVEFNRLLTLAVGLA